MIIIMNCLRKLNQKWNLTEQKLVDEGRFYELVDLVTDEVMPKEALIDLLLSDNPDYASIARTLNERQMSRSLSNSYRYIRNLNSNIREFEDVSRWLIDAMEIKNILPADMMAYLPVDNIAFLEIGKFNEPVPFEGAVHLKAEENLCELFTDSLRELWLYGVDILWETLYKEGSYKKVVLPGYPFDRKSFWLTRNGNGNGQGQSQAQGQSQSQGREAKEYSSRVGMSERTQAKSRLRQVDQKGLRYSRSFSIQDPIIQDHVITGKPLIPGASLIELGLEAGQRASNQPVNFLRNIIIQNPGIIEMEKSPQPPFIKGGEGGIFKEAVLEVEIISEEKRFIVKKVMENSADTLCMGEFEKTEGEPLPSLDLHSYIQHQPQHQPQDISDLYLSLSRIGYQYGNGLQVIENIWKNESGFLFELKKPSQDEGQVTSLNPRILDGVFQAALAVEYLEGRLQEDNTLFVPYFIKSFMISGEIKDRCFVCIDKQDIQRKGQDLNVHFRVSNASGDGVLLILDMLLKRVSNQFLSSKSQSSTRAEVQSKIDVQNNEHSDVYYYKPVWIKQALHTSERHTPERHTPEYPKLQRSAILLVDESDLSAQLSQEVILRYQKVFFISKGTAFSNKGNNHFEINAHQAQDYVDAIQAIDKHIVHPHPASPLKGEGEIYIDCSAGKCDIYHLWAYEPQIFPILTPQDLTGKQGKGVQSLFFLAKALTRVQPRYAVKIIVCTYAVHVVEPHDTGEGYAFGGLLGLAKTITMENPKLKIKMVDFGSDNLPLPEKAATLIDESLSWETPGSSGSTGPSASMEVAAYRTNFPLPLEGGGRVGVNNHPGRYVRAFEPYQAQAQGQGTFAENQQVPALKDKGVYLLIGGAGGIGLKVAEMITKQVKARLILVGRSALTPEKRRQIEQLQTNGNQILFIQADVTNPEHMRKLLKIIKAEYGAINGFIQAGGVLEDKLLVSKDWESFQRVMASKVQGTWIINQLTQTEPLDFFVVFSSIVSIVGNIGQVDYAAANSFMDEFIHYRAQHDYPGKSLSINWIA